MRFEGELRAEVSESSLRTQSGREEDVEGGEREGSVSRGYSRLESCERHTATMWQCAPVDVMEVVLSHLDLPSLATARVVCRQWSEATRSNTTLVAASRNTDRLLTRLEICRLLGLARAESFQLPCRPIVTRRGQTCWLFSPPDVVAKALELARSRTSREADHASVQYGGAVESLERARKRVRQ